MQNETFVIQRSMKAAYNYRATKTACSDRQVLILGTSWADPQPGTMEEIRISIVNDKATRNKRNIEEETDLSPPPKKLRSAVFLCSTPSSAPHCSQNVEVFDEFDDSLLEASSDESDSPLHMTLVQIEELLEDDCDYAAEPPRWDEESDSVGFLQELAVPNGSQSDLVELRNLNSPLAGEQSDSSQTLTEETVCSQDTSNYAAMAPSPCWSNISTAGQNEEAGGNVSTTTSPVLHKHEMDRGSRDSDICSTLSSSHLPGDLKVVDEISETSDIPFDGDIDELLTLSPGDTTSSEEDKITSESTPILSKLESVPVVHSHSEAFCKSSSSLQLPETSLASSTEPSPSLQLSASSVTAMNGQNNSNKVPPPTSDTAPGPQLGTDTNSQKSKGQKVEPKKNKPIEQIGLKQGGKSFAASVDHPVKENLGQTSKEQVAASIGCKKKVNPSPLQEKKHGAVPTKPRAACRPQISNSELEKNRNIYRDRVMMHLEVHSISEEPNYELAYLLNETSRENPTWQHPSDYTKRNYYVRRQPAPCSLNDWVMRNGGHSIQRFHGLPCTFKRSPMPGVLPTGPT
ncbi:S100P-binding protein isoform X1 [Xenopus laevis]|uniref:S100P-binding protein n=3 Tax=Xenopus laevis TaxID=8355 RepID=A0A8J0UCN5_XENLA|nr:S100P-binding protein isoform X1 [Xenopus laevis]